MVFIIWLLTKDYKLETAKYGNVDYRYETEGVLDSTHTWSRSMDTSTWSISLSPSS